MLCVRSVLKLWHRTPDSFPKGRSRVRDHERHMAGLQQEIPPGELTPQPPKRTKKVLLPPVDPSPPVPPAETEHPQAQELPMAISSPDSFPALPIATSHNSATYDSTGSTEISIFLPRNTSKKTVKRIASSIVTGAYSTVGEITKAASGALNWLGQTGFEEPPTANGTHISGIGWAGNGTPTPHATSEAPGVVTKGGTKTVRPFEELKGMSGGIAEWQSRKASGNRDTIKRSVATSYA
ncbi:hypothetical protein EV426DRAFT_575303 [Tirmania nivea]|nr:hypothetical protein EV426DRAFT_575303 [Tirmania nivea]